MARARPKPKPRTPKRRGHSTVSKKKGRDNVRKMDATYRRSINALVDRLFEEAYKKEWNWMELAYRSGLSDSTVRKLGNRDTVYPQYRTVELLAYALGGAVTWTKNRDSALQAIVIHWKPESFSGRRKLQVKVA